MEVEKPPVRKPRHYHGYLFFLPASELIRLVHGATAFENAYESCPLKTRRWPSWKSLYKWAFAKNPAFPVRPSSLRAIDAMIEDTGASVMFDDAADIWQAEREWTGVFHSGIFKDPRSLTYWRRWLDLDKELGCEVLPLCTSMAQRIDAITSSTLASELGCPSSVLWLQEASAEHHDPAFIHSQIFGHSRIADLFAVIVRMSAWVVAEATARDWPAVQANHAESDVLLLPLVPRFDAQTGQWSRPIAEQLGKLAFECGHRSDGTASAFLGRVWAGEHRDIPDKQRTLRNWEHADPVRPSEASLDDLLMTLKPDLARHAALWSDATAQRARFKFAWLNVALLRYMQKQNMEACHIQEVFDVFEAEYRKARANLGRPMTP